MHDLASKAQAKPTNLLHSSRILGDFIPFNVTHSRGNDMLVVTSLSLYLPAK